jgi:membrane protease YdiL (CAAX protease family)
MKSFFTPSSGRFFYILAAGLLTFFLHYTFASRLPEWSLWIVKTGLPALFGIIWLNHKRRRHPIYARINLGFFIVNMALFITFLLAPLIENLFNLNDESARGLALVKLTECTILSASIIFLATIGGVRPKELYLAKGRLCLGLLIGIITFSGMVILGLIQPGPSSISADFLVRFAPWLLLFVFANAFMEELMFRGLFLKQLSLRPWASNLVIALFFTAAHMQVTYAPDLIQFLVILLVLALLWGWIIHKTGSLIASVFFHAGADVVIMYGVFNSYGIPT